MRMLEGVYTVDRISVIGLGKLGACSAACFALKGFKTIGVDINKSYVHAINNGKAPIYEPGLEEAIGASKGRLSATQSYSEAIKESDISFLIVPTPSREDGHFSDIYLRDSLRSLARALKEADKKYHLFVITSTVSPRTTNEKLIPLIESESGKKLNKGFGVCYNPEFVALGTVIADFLSPDLVLIGESDKYAGDKLEEIYKVACENKPYVARMSIVSSEITKISLNSYVTMKISFANNLAAICKKIPGADIDKITKALGSDKRISPYYLKAGLGYGGPCFPRDNKAFAAFSDFHSVDAKLAKATDAINNLATDDIVNFILDNITNNSTISLLGLAYKPNTSVIEESPSIKIIDALLKKMDIEIIAYDPLAMDNARAYFGDKIVYASNVNDCFTNSSICVISTQLEEFKRIDKTYIGNKPITIIDCWRMLENVNFGANVKYVEYGKLYK